MTPVVNFQWPKISFDLIDDQSLEIASELLEKVKRDFENQLRKEEEEAVYHLMRNHVAKCIKCNKGMKEGVTLHRVNPTGEKGIWLCTECLTPEEKKKIDPEVQRIVSVIEEDSKT